VKTPWPRTDRLPDSGPVIGTLPARGNPGLRRSTASHSRRDDPRIGIGGEQPGDTEQATTTRTDRLPKW